MLYNCFVFTGQLLLGILFIQVSVFSIQQIIYPSHSRILLFLHTSFFLHISFELSTICRRLSENGICICFICRPHYLFRISGNRCSCTAGFDPGDVFGHVILAKTSTLVIDGLSCDLCFLKQPPITIINCVLKLLSYANN